MRRETKAGLVVTCSFLTLLGVVLFSKYRQIDLDRAAGLVAAAGGAEGAAAGTAAAGAAPASLAGAMGIGPKAPSGVVQASHQEMQTVEGGPLPIRPTPPEATSPKAAPPAPTPPPAPAPRHEASNPGGMLASGGNG